MLDKPKRLNFLSKRQDVVDQSKGMSSTKKPNRLSGLKTGGKVYKNFRRAQTQVTTIGQSQTYSQKDPNKISTYNPRISDPDSSSLTSLDKIGQIDKNGKIEPEKYYQGILKPNLEKGNGSNGEKKETSVIGRPKSNDNFSSVSARMKKENSLHQQLRIEHSAEKKPNPIQDVFLKDSLM